MVSGGGGPWTGDEIQVVVARYFAMLRAELAEQPYVKAQLNREVQALTGRSRGSVERKFQNVSAILLGMGAVFVDGYKPLGNVQQALREAVMDRWLAEPDIEALMLAQAVRPVGPPRVDLVWTVTQPPSFSPDPTVGAGRQRVPVQIDFVKLEADRRDLGRAGEEAVVRFEKDRLVAQGRERLARLVEHVSVTKGDGLGYDVLSFDGHGEEVFIEVKTTRRPREYPFLLTRNEVSFSAEVPDRFRLYRVYAFTKPKTGLYTLAGSLEETCRLTPAIWLARPA